MGKKKSKIDSKSELIKKLAKGNTKKENDIAGVLGTFNQDLQQSMNQSLVELAARKTKPRKVTKKSAMGRTHVAERDKLVKVMEFSFFKANPFGAIQQHIQNSRNSSS